MHAMNNAAPARRERRPTRRGAMLPLIALLLPAIIIFLGFAVDVAYMQNTRLELRAATDAAARAAATTLSQSADQSAALVEGTRVAGANLVAGAPLTLDPADFQFGRSERAGAGRWAFTPGGTPANAVRVVGGRTGSSSDGVVSLFFGGLIGVTNFEPEFAATASFLNVDICLVLDRSTSMKVDVDSTESGLYTSDPRFCAPPGSKSRWEALHQAVQTFTDTLRSTPAAEQVALATYSSAFNSSTYCGTSSQASSLNRALSADLSVIDSSVDTLSNSIWNGNTNIESGIRTGLAELTSGTKARPTANRVLIVMTDGNQNVGNAEAAANDCAYADVQVHTVTFSIDANQSLMRSVAQRAGGRHLHADTTDELKKVFRELAAQSSQITD